MEGPEGSPYQVRLALILRTFLSSSYPLVMAGKAVSMSHFANPLLSNQQNGKFEIKLSLPTGYPFKPPTVSFTTKIYHPNVTNDDKGSMCLGMLRADEWKPSSKIGAVLQFARQLLAEPMPDDAVEGRIAEQFKNDRKRYDELAREWTRKHAMSS